jgi:two-component system chemotaxis response regulator CheB
MPGRRIKVLIVDDSAVVRKILTDGLAAFPEIEVVGTAVDPYVARDKILALQPDVLTLDIEMPRMDGLSFLKLLMRHRPMPVIVISSLTSAASAKALEALQSGAVDVVAKPNGPYSVQSDCRDLVSKIKAAFHARVIRPTPGAGAGAGPAPVVKPPLGAQRIAGAGSTINPPVTSASHLAGRPAGRAARQYSSKPIILMGASTGGTEALKQVLTALPADVPGICVVQHIPAHFSRAFADRLNALCQLEVREARAGDRVEPGLILIAPGGFHMVLRRASAHYVVELNEGPTLHHQRPAVDVLFDSAVKMGAAPHALALLLTGMGSDGSAGLLKLREAGASTVAQNEATCVVFGMPREAIRLGAAQSILPLEQMSGCIDRFATEQAASVLDA